MRSRLLRDLARWEAGVINAAALDEAHPGSDIPRLIAFYCRFALLGAAPSPNPEPTWIELKAHLPPREPSASAPG